MSDLKGCSCWARRTWRPSRRTTYTFSCRCLDIVGNWLGQPRSKADSVQCDLECSMSARDLDWIRLNFGCLGFTGASALYVNDRENGHATEPDNMGQWGAAALYPTLHGFQGIGRGCVEAQFCFGCAHVYQVKELLEQH